MKFRSKRSPLRSQKIAKQYNRSRGSRTGSRTFGLRFQVNRVNTHRRYARSPPLSKSKSKSLSNENKNENKNRQTHRDHILKEQPVFSPYSKYKLDFGNRRRHIQFKDDETLEQIRRFPSSNSLGRRMVKWGPAKTISYQEYKIQEDNKFKMQLIKQIDSWREISELRGNIAWPLLSTKMSLDSIETEYEKLRSKLASRGRETQ